VSFPWSRNTTFLLCSPSWSAFGCCARERVWRDPICWFKDERSCLIIEVNSLISTGRSSNSVFLLATVCCQHSFHYIRLQKAVRCANFSNFPIVTVMPRPISAALLAKSDLFGFPSPIALPFAAAFCESVRSDCLCAPTFEGACRLCTWVRTDLNSLVRSWIEETAIWRVWGDRGRGP